MGDVSRYQEWTYETACGRTVTAALAEDRGVLIADLEDCLVTVNVPRAELERQDLEALADSIDFGRLTPVTAPDLSGQGADTQLNTGSGLETGAIRTFAAELLDLLERDNRAAVAERFSYPCTVTTAEGETFQADTAQELLDRWDEAVAPVTGTLSEALMGGDFFSHDGLVGTADGAVWFGLTETDRSIFSPSRPPRGRSPSRLRHQRRAVPGAGGLTFRQKHGTVRTMQQSATGNSIPVFCRSREKGRCELFRRARRALEGFAGEEMPRRRPPLPEKEVRISQMRIQVGPRTMLCSP